jgi:DNA-binding response OmpR family regulator
MEPLAKSNILVVDDDEKSTLVIQDLLEFEGYRVYTARNGREALEQIEKHPLDLVITDFQMPVMNGFELLQAINRSRPELPVIMLTGQYREDMEKAITALKEGAYDYMLKPVDLTKLRRSVFTTLQVSQAKKESQALTEVLERTLTELNKKGEKLEELTRLHNDLLNIVSRDLEAPLTILTGSCKMLLKEEDSDLSERHRQLLELISRQGKDIQAIIGDLFDLAVVDMGQIELHKVETHIQEILEKCRRNLYSVAGNKGITISVQPPSGLKPVYVDEGRMKQVFFNLLHQAIELSNRNGSIRVGIVPLPHDQRIEILFKSSTVLLDKIQQIFDGQEIIKGIAKQIRYRLNHCREIVELHEGKIWVEEGIEGETLFCVQVPNLFKMEPSAENSEET